MFEMSEDLKKTMVQISKELSKTAKEIKEKYSYLQYQRMVPPQVFDFLKAIKVDLDDPGNTEPKNYFICTRKAKGKKFFNPSFPVTKQMFDSLGIVLRNYHRSIAMDSRDIKFFPDTGELRIWGFSAYIKKDSPRYDLCKYMFEKKRYPRGWQFRDLAIAIGENLDANDLEDLKDKVRGKVRYLNQDVSDAIGIDEFIIEELGKFVLNPVNIPKLH